MSRLHGQCHCGAVRVEIEGVEAADLPLRACQCGFCRRHRALGQDDTDVLDRTACRNAARAPHAGSVQNPELALAPVHDHVHRVARLAGHFVYYHLLGAKQPVDE